MRYGVSTVGDKNVLYASPYNNEIWVMGDKYEYAYDESSNSLLVLDSYNKTRLLAITADGKIVIGIPTIMDYANRPFIERTKAKFIMNFCSIVFGYKVLLINRFSKNRMYVYPDAEEWVDWDSNPLVEKYVIDENAPAVILDMNMKVIYGATPQKNPSNKRVNGHGQSLPRVKKESDW